MTLVEILAWLLIIVPAFPLAATVIFVGHRFWRVSSPSLRERAAIAIRDALVASMAAAIALNIVFGWDWPAIVRLILLAGGMVLVSLPSAWWLFLYARGAFR